MFPSSYAELQCLQSTHSIYFLLEKYLPPNVWTTLDKNLLNCDATEFVKIEDYVQCLFDKSFDYMKRYQSPKHFAEQLKDFQKFTGSYDYFGNKHSERFHTVLSPYRTSDRKTYHSLKDMFWFLEDIFQENLCSLPWTIPLIAAYCKTIAEAFEDSFEYVKVDRMELLDMRRDYQHYLDDQRTKIEKGVAPEKSRLQSVSREILLDHIACHFFDSNWTNDEIDFFKSLLPKLDNPQETDDNCTYLMARKIFQTLNEAVKTNPHFFQSAGAVGTKENPHFVRLFEDKRCFLVMEEEINKVLGKQTENHLFLRTLKGHKAKELVEGIENVTFLNIAIAKTSHRALPIRAPDNSHCQLAADFLFQVLDDLFFGQRIFQKLKPEEWIEVTKFFDKLEKYFDANEENPYFIRFTDFAETWITDYFSQFANRPAETIRDVGPDGFEEKDFEDELVHLKLNLFFEEIKSKVSLAYHLTVGSMEPNTLLTSHMFDAVANAQKLCLFARLPNLQTFLHNQKRCIYPPFCKLCNPDQPDPGPFVRPKNNSTKWKSIGVDEIKFLDMGLQTRKEVMDKVMMCRNVKGLVYNVAFYTMLEDVGLAFGHDRKHTADLVEEVERGFGEQGFSKQKVFLMDENDYELALSYLSDDIDNDLDWKKVIDSILLPMQSLKNFTEIVNEEKKIYLRTFSTQPIDREEHRRCFVTEFAEIVPIALKQQGTDLDQLKYDRFLVACLDSEEDLETMNLATLKSYLEHFDIDKELITLVPDISYAFEVKYQMPLSSGYSNMTVIGPHHEKLVTFGQAVFRIFQHVVCEVDWKIEVLDGLEFEDSKEFFKQEVLRAMLSFEVLDLIPQEHVDTVIDRLKELSNYLERKARLMVTPLIKLFDCDFNDQVSLRFFLEECSKFNIAYINSPATEDKNLDECFLPVWKIRLLFMYEWMQIFFDGHDDSERMRKHVLSGIYSRAPILKWANFADFINLIRMTDPDAVEYAHELERESASFPVTAKNHEWFATTSWKDRLHKEGSLRLRSQEHNSEEMATQHLRSIMKWSWEAWVKLDEDGALTLSNLGSNDYDFSDDVFRLVEEGKGNFKMDASLTKELQTLTLETTSTPNPEKQVEEAKENVLDQQSPVKNKKKKKKAAKEAAAIAVQDPPLSSEEQNECQSSIETNHACTDLKKQLEESKKEIEDLRERIKQLEQEIREKENSPRKKLQTLSKLVPAESQKESSTCPKCVRSSDARKAVQKDLDAKTNEANKLAKQLSAKDRKLKELEERYEGKVPREVLEKEIEDLKSKYEGKKTREELEKEMEEMAKVIERLEEESAQQAKLQEETDLKVKELNSMIDQLEVSNEQIVMRTSELEANILEKQEVIDIFKQQFPKEILVNLGFKLPLEMKKVLVELQEKQDPILSQNPLGEKRNLVDRFISLTKDHYKKQRAEHEFLVFKVKFNEYEAKISESIVMIQANPLIARTELPDVPELPDLPKEFYEELENARNKQLDHECVICLKKKRWRETWFICPGCPKNFHRRCMYKWFLEKGDRSCPHCRIHIAE